MKKGLLSLFLLLILFSFNKVAMATHIVGGEINYKYQGNNTYSIILTVYRDCFNGVPPFDNPAYISVFGSDNSRILDTTVALNDQSNIPNTTSWPCLIPPTNICYEVAHYYINLVLPPRAGGYQIAYQRCCRNSTIINIVNPGGAGDTFVANIPDGNLYQSDINPFFNSLPPTFVCNSVPFTIDQSATDYDGDSLSYEFCTPYDAPSSSLGTSPPSAPPYSPVQFIGPYSITNLVGGSMTIDSHTGLIHVTPNGVGQFVYGVRVIEYRNGVAIGETRRDYQVNIVECQGITVASIFSPTLTCGTLTANFVNQSYGAGSYLWNFGNLSTLGDTSNALNPSYTYPAPGTYWATLIAYSSVNPACNDTDSSVVHIYPVPIADFSYAIPPCDSQLHFTNLSTNGTYYNWSFGDGHTSTESNPIHYYDTAGTFTIILTASFDSICADTASKTYTQIADSLHKAGVIPNIFTPNGDDKNETFYLDIKQLCPPEDFKIDIFDRWGILVYESTDYQFHWDGKNMGGNKCSEGVYYYIAKTNSNHLKGYVHLQR